MREARTRVHLIGEVGALSAAPTRFELRTAAHGRIEVSFPALLFPVINELVGQPALVTADVNLNEDGRPDNVAAVDASALVHGGSSLRDWEVSRGSYWGREIWEGTEAEEYLRDLRRARRGSTGRPA